MIQRRRFLQISIRTLLIVTTLVAIGCAYWTRVLHRMEQQRLAAARIADLGEKTKSRQTANAWPWLKQLVGEEYFKEVVLIDLDDTQVTNDDVALIGSFRRLESLSMKGLDPPRRSFWRPLPQNPMRLGSQITDQGIQRLGRQDYLLDAQLAQTKLTDDSMRTIASWSQVEGLGLRATKVTSSGILQRGLKRLKKLDLKDTLVDDAAVETLCEFRSLRELDLQGTLVSGEALLRLREALPHCDLQAAFLDLSAGVDPDPDSMRWKEITRQLWNLSRNAELKLLILSGTAATDKHLVDLDRLENTDVIDLRGTSVTKAGVDTLQRAAAQMQVAAIADAP